MSTAAHTPIPMAPGYFASPNGIIFSASGWRGLQYRRLTSDLNSHGYPCVRVLIGGKRKRIAIHRLMASAFLPDRPSPQHEVRHLDGTRVNNAEGNLAWGTRAENAADRAAHGRTSHGAVHSEAIKRGFQRRAA